MKGRSYKEDKAQMMLYGKSEHLKSRYTKKGGESAKCCYGGKKCKR